MDIHTYLTKFPEAREYESYILGSDQIQRKNKKRVKQQKRTDQIQVGALLFTEESAYELSGPFPGNAAIYYLTDFRLCPVRGQSLETDQALRESMWARYQKDLFLLKRTETEVERIVEEVVSRSWTVEKPIRLYVMGTDDSSWTKLYATVEEAEQDLALLQSAQPLDFHKDFLAMGFFFSN